ncbi:hypothetical protein [Mucilaginibacter sp. UR6-11]|uniref:hypothetical protein n=1 Tax=Mucilaginibacter sp. UR6-11 TaxID=1435644 RepID=UPI001E5BDAC8|nr:hypothetical protein [Mucilaginibacter sp. UR6-11]MCC8424714.1 hypothetical protein [Mucilaginibacter sp. UR6-11]
MKNLNLIYAVLLLLAFASCKKEANPQISSTQPQVPVIAPIRDSVSYTIDGKTYSAGGMSLNNISSGGEDANRKLVFTNDNNIPGYSLVGKPDSVMYFQKNAIYSNSANINVFFLKKCARQKQGLPWMPGLTDVLKLFTVGKHPLAEDFEWQNSQNGIAIDVTTNNKEYSSYNAYNGVNTVIIPPGFQNNSTFEILSFTTTSNGGGYNLEAKFTAVVFGADGQQKQLTNGYLRLNFGVYYNTLAN